MSFQTVLSIVGVAFSAFEMYKRFRPKVSSGSAQSPISPREEPKQSEAAAGATADAEPGKLEKAKLEATSKNLRNVEERSAVSSKIGMV